MNDSYIGFFTLTDAQRARELLERQRIPARVARMPSEPGISCAYGLKLASAAAREAAELLKSAGFRLGKTVVRRAQAKKR